MTVVKEDEKFNRNLTIIAGVFCFVAWIFTLVSLCTPSWTIDEYSADGEVQWHGLFYRCSRHQCTLIYKTNIFAIFITTASAIFLLLTIIGILLMSSYKVFRRCFYLTSLSAWYSLILLFIALIIYAKQSVINGISARLMILSIVLTSISTVILSHIAGKYSIYYKKVPTNFNLATTKTNIEIVKNVEEQ